MVHHTQPAGLASNQAAGITFTSIVSHILICTPRNTMHLYILTILIFVHKTRCNIIGEEMLYVENNILQCSVTVDIPSIHSYSIFSTYNGTISCATEQSNIYGTMNGYAGYGGSTFFCNDYDSAFDCRAGCSNEQQICVHQTVI